MTQTSDANLIDRFLRGLNRIRHFIGGQARGMDGLAAYDHGFHVLSPVPLPAPQPPIPLLLGLAPEGSALSVCPQSPPPIWLPEYCNLTDLGNARRMARLYGADLRYVGASKHWLIWDGTRWTVDDTGAVERLAKETVRQMYLYASATKDGRERSDLIRWALNSESRTRLLAMIDLAKSEEGIAISPDQPDQGPMLLNVANGTIDLRSGRLRPHRREDLITKLAPVTYDANATSPTWDRFLAQIMSGNDGLLRFLQKAVGYALTGDTSEQVIFILHGEGANGKSTFLSTVAAVLGDYARQTPVDTLLASHGTKIPNDLARLNGARFVTAAEAEHGHRMAEGLVKQITGGDKVAARFLYAEFFEFEPTFKVFLATNHKPLIEGTDYAIWRRIRLVPFTVTIPEDEQDKALASKLRQELPGILRWAVEGCLAWQREGLDVPPEVQAATAAYRADTDRVGRFLEDCCVLDPSAQTRAGELHDAYRSWCDANGEDCESAKALRARLGERGFERHRDKHGRFYRGLALKGTRGTGEDR